ncbi:MULTISPECIES: hypothetical protein [Flavobacteriaceae]|uniref:DUF4145 domain-containing protein n=2 Tax=Flavobacteriaceae TaxID=49546 RepID=A0A4Y8ATB5_9FLAO|nr:MULTISPECIES: hypothetical protein [Flavobacteriaceae]TEW75125.1 hypothetical protein E2488_06275 [Gramella jeungdoensis]GGK41380.1 hypothetical protein GCM10007963_06750 [Lutibacter litoralis]
MSKKPNKIRATANATDGVGMQRYATYKAAISRISESIKKGFYLEAITLCESLIADRLESRLKYLTDSDVYSFKTLGKLQEGIGIHETNKSLIDLVKFKTGTLDKWRDSRNKVLHAMAKIENGDSREWEDKMEECKRIALAGEELRKEIFKIIDKLKR